MTRDPGASPFDQDRLASVTDLRRPGRRRPAVELPDTVVEHEVHSERRRVVLNRGTWRQVELEKTRYVCSCGMTSSWCKNWLQARRQMDRHALDHQLSWRV